MISTIGRYFLLMAKVFSPPGKRKLFWKQVVEEIHQLGFDSIPIVSLVSIFVGAAITIQLQINMDSPWIPIYAVGFATRKAIVMELAPTIIGLILAGKIGSHIASQLGTMRVTEQIDAIEVMGLNSASYLIQPKIIACLIFNPILIMLSIVAALFGGWAVGISIGLHHGLIRSIRQYHLRIFILPAGVILGSLLGGAVCGLITGRSVFEGAAVAGGLGWYSLAGVTLENLIGVQTGSIAFLSNLMRELFSFFSIPFLSRKNYYACIAAAGATSEDTTLPLMIRYTSEETVILSVLNGAICSAFVPVLLSLCFWLSGL